MVGFLRKWDLSLCKLRCFSRLEKLSESTISTTNSEKATVELSLLPCD